MCIYIYASDSMIKLICSKASNLQRKMKVGQIGAFFLDNSKSFYLLPIFWVPAWGSIRQILHQPRKGCITCHHHQALL